MEMPWRATIALSHPDCDIPDLVVVCDTGGPLVESGEVEVLACSDQMLKLPATPEQVCVHWEALEGFCLGGERGRA